VPKCLASEVSVHPGDGSPQNPSRSLVDEVTHKPKHNVTLLYKITNFNVFLYMNSGFNRGGADLALCIHLKNRFNLKKW